MVLELFAANRLSKPLSRRRARPLLRRGMAYGRLYDAYTCDAYKFLLRPKLQGFGEPGWYRGVLCSRPQDDVLGAGAFLFCIYP